MIRRAVTYWCVTFVVIGLGLQLAYWGIYITVSLGGLVGLSQGGWPNPVGVSFSRAMFVFPAFAATVLLVVGIRDWLRDEDASD